MANEPTSGGASAPPPKPQRAWRAACPGCGATVDFASAASASAVCSFCRSTLLRDGEALRRIGVSAELFDDHSALQLGASGTHQGLHFTLVGRLQYRYADGTWNEWHALFEGAGEGGGKSAWLSEDNGAYVLSFDQPGVPQVPPATQLYLAQRLVVGGRAWDMASIQQASLIAAEGELPRPPKLKDEFTVADLRNERGEVGTLDYADPAAPLWSVGTTVTLAGLKMQGLHAGPAEKTLAAQGMACPSCGAPLQPTLASTRAITCGQCHAVVDVSQGPGADLQHYAQNNAGAQGVGPLIPLGTTGRIALGIEAELDWQVVGYQERCDLPDAGSDDEQSFWREYLLYHRTAGFAFLVDAEDGWSWVRPLTGAPVQRGTGAEWQGQAYRKRYTYTAKSTWVLGEFYWQVRKDERALVTDFDGPGGAKLSREQTGKEVVWSAGQALDVKAVARAFGVQPGALAAMRRDASPLSGLTTSSGSSGMGLSQGMVILIVVVIVMLLMTQCSSSDACKRERQAFGEASAEYQQCQRNHSSGGFRTGGGSFGGFSSGGGGHK